MGDIAVPLTPERQIKKAMNVTGQIFGIPISFADIYEPIVIYQTSPN